MTPERQKKIVVSILVVAFLCYSFFLYSSLPVKEHRVSSQTIEGKTLWQRHNCTACHQVYGLGGYLGPDLTNVYSLKGAGYIKAFLGAGTISMPDFHFNPKEIDALLAYLRNIDSSGSADPRTFTINNDGTIAQ